MTKISQRIELKIGADGVIVLRQPTVKEWNDFMARGYPGLRGGRLIAASSVEARVDLFDLLLVDVRNLEDDEGPITAETKGRIPVTMKVEAIFVGFEQGSGIDLLKNSGGTSGDFST